MLEDGYLSISEHPYLNVITVSKHKGVDSSCQIPAFCLC